MHRDMYDDLAQALDRLPGRFPATPSHAERPLLRKLFASREARLASVMGHEPEPAIVLAERAGMSVAATGPLLQAMAEEGLVAVELTEGATPGADAPHSPAGPRYRLEPFLPGVFEARVADMDEEFAFLFEAYMADGGARAIMGPDPAIARVLPTTAARSEWILPYDDVRTIIEATGSIVLNDCVCRLERDKVGAPCRFPRHVCLDLAAGPRPDDPGLISKEEALAVIDEAEERGLVHTVSNVAGGWDWICNCCSCCCEFLRALTEWQVDTAVVRNYRAVVDDDACTGCGICEERCQVKAIAVADDLAAVDHDHCLGCGLCVTTCRERAVRLERLPDPDVTVPPADPEAWAQERLRRGGG
jgi:H+/Na+-translocating ferredoxin:NAD+ oxidoreductase subunit B